MRSSIDIINCLYHELFSVRFLHSGYGTPLSNTISNDIKIYPDEDTKRMFSGFDIGYRFINDILICFMRSERAAPPSADKKVPFIPLLDEVRIRFIMHVSQSFLNRTVIIAAGKRQVYNFSNRINNVIDDQPFISLPIDPYNASSDYDAGTIVEQGGQLFGGIKPIRGSENIAITDQEYWSEINPPEQLVNNADLENPTSLVLEETCFAVIDVYYGGTTNPIYDLFVTGPDNHLRSPVYSLKFKSKI